MNLELPAESENLLAWAWLVLGWVLTQYLPIPPRPALWRRLPDYLVRAVAAGIVALLVIDGDSGRVGVAVALAVGGAALLTLGHAWADNKSMAALWELVIPALFLSVAAVMIAETAVEPRLWLPALEGRPATMLYPVLVLAAVVYSWEAGSRVVAGVLARMSIPADDATVIESSAASRGELIGRLERLVLIVLVTQGAYTALGFLIAAKGFVRSKEFDDDRDFAEYFLIGTLVSMTLGLMLGIGVAALT